MVHKCGEIEITPDALKRVSLAAREWSARADLSVGQKTMARALEQQAARLATASAVTGRDIALVKKLCCRLFAVVNAGAQPGPGRWPCSPPGDLATRLGATSFPQNPPQP